MVRKGLKCDVVRRRVVLLCLLIAFAAGQRLLAVAPHGVLDTSFNSNGRLILDLSLDSILHPTDDVARAVLVQPDGKILAAGYTDGGAADFAVARFNPDGTLDSTFSGDGIARASFGGLDYALAMALQVDGKVLVAGYTDNGGAPGIDDFAIARFTAAGALDTTFDGDGLRVVDFGGNDRAVAIAVLNDNRIAVAGLTGVGTGDIAAAVINEDGSLSTGFDGDGRATVDVSGGADSAAAIAIDASGRLVIAGATGSNVAVVRLTTSGALDGSFDGDGKLSVDFGSTDRATAIAIKPDGSIVVAGNGVTVPSQGWVMRLSSNGAFDTTFSGDGRVTLGFSPGAISSVQGVRLLFNGKIAIAGGVLESGSADVITAVLASDGSPDTTFNGSGVLRTDVSAGLYDRAWALDVQADGSLVVAGQVSFDTNAPANFALIRVGAETAVDTTFDEDGQALTVFGGNANAVGRGVVTQPDGKTVVVGSADNGAFNVVRLTSAGAVDTSFGAAGYRTVWFGGSDSPAAVLRDAFGRFLIVGVTTADPSGGTGDQNVAVTRLTAGGALDTTFNSLASPTASNGNGRLVVEMSTTDNDRAVAAALEPGGFRTVVATTVGGAGGFGVAMLNGSGRLDTSFSGDGQVVVSFGTNNAPHAIAFQPDRKILIAGTVTVGAESRMAVARLTTAGNLDTTFDGDGWAIFDWGNPSSGQCIWLQADQRIVVAGTTTVGGVNRAAVGRLTSTGAMDVTFSGDGMTAFTFGDGEGSSADVLSGLSIRTDGAIVVSGYNALVGPQPQRHVVAARLLPDGSLDPAFADKGLLFVRGGRTGSGNAAIMEPATGKVVITGSSSDPTVGLVVRLATDPGGAPPLQTMSINDVTVTEGHAGSTNVNFTLSLSAPSNFPVTYRVLTADGTAIAPGDYSGASGAAVLVPGATSVVIQTQVFGDVIDEPNEAFTVVVSEVLGATLVKGVGTATILDDDVAVQITSPTSAPTFAASQALIGIGGTASDVQGLQTVTWTTSTGAAGAATGTSTWTASVPLVAGANVVTVTARGANGYTATDTLSIDVSQFTAYLAEGATSNFLDTRIAMLNPGAIDTTATMTFARAGNTNIVQPVLVPSHTRVTINPKTIPGLEVAEFSTAVTSSQPLVVDRTMSWDSTGYGAHAETAVPAPSTTWYLAEGATHSGFDLFYLLQNPAAHATTVRVRYLRPAGTPLVKDYTLPARSRTNIWVNVEDFPGLGLALAATDVSAEVTSLDATPIIVERALYLTSQGRLFNAGHESAGVTAPALQWFLAEGATGPYFDLFVLIANPGSSDAQVRLTYLLTNGQTHSRTLTAPANSRSNVWVDQESFDGGATYPLANVAVSTTVASENSVPIIVERALWWPGDFATWHEAHNSAGATQTGTVWALAEGEVAGPGVLSADETYILIANASAFAGTARVTLYFEDGTSTALDYPLAANSRTNVAVGPDFGAIASGRKFGAVITSLGGTPAQIVVERAMYRDAGGVTWAAGTNALATRLQ